MTVVTHANAPLGAEDRRRLLARSRTRAIANVAMDMRISRATSATWMSRYERFGDIGLLDRSFTPVRRPTATDSAVIERIEHLRFTQEGSSARIEFELACEGRLSGRRAISRSLAQLVLDTRRFVDPTGANHREPQRIDARRPGRIVHVDIKKAGRMPDGGG